MIVVDASIVAEILLRTADGMRIFERLTGDDVPWHAPHLVDLEVMHGLRRYAALGDLSPARAAEALELLRILPMRRHAHEPLLERMWALRSNLTAYDSAYVALAEGLNATLLTRDRKLSAVPVVRGSIELV